MSKRLFDLFVASLGLVLLAPLFVLVALCVKLDSPGPVFFRQTRVGQFGGPFRIFKFRTMHVETGEDGSQITIGGDPRITRTGRFLRRHKLDELPQLINVFFGQMSIVGPRPEVPKYVALYPAATRDLVLSVKPGVTDPASIEYKSENELLGRSSDPEQTYVNEIMPAKLRLCSEYVTHRSLWRDVQIVIATVRALVTPTQR